MKKKPDIISMQWNCFSIKPKDLRSITYQFVEQLNIKYTFKKDKEEAGYIWLKPQNKAQKGRPFFGSLPTIEPHGNLCLFQHST